MKPPRYRQPLRVALCVDRAQKYSDQVLKGILQYVNIHGPWALFLDPRFTGQHKPHWLKSWQGDGVIGYVEDIHLAKHLLDSRIPAVEVFGHRYDLGLPQVCPDGFASGQMAARHLMERRFKNFAFCGYRDQPWSEQRQQGFVDALKNAGFSARTHLVSRRYRRSELGDLIQKQLHELITSSPLPVGIMACSDRHAQRVLAVCHSARICVPDEAAIIGSGNDEEFCFLSNPPLSSVIYDTERIGYEAAERLHQIILGNGKAARATTNFIPPLGIATRGSTNILAVSDKLIANMGSFIRERSKEGLGVKELAAEFRVSRTTCYRRFKSILDRTPHQEIQRARMDRAKELLSQTDLAVERVAEIAGFQNTEYFYVVFKRDCGLTPRQFRLECKSPGGAR